MTRKTLSLLALICASAFALPGTASACATSAWTTVVGAVTAGSPPAVSRYSGKCAALSTATGNYVQDDSPGTEKNYFAQFYVFTGLSAGGATVFRARNANALPSTAIQVDYNRGDGTNGNFTFTSNGTTAVNGVKASKWYMIRMSWTANAPNTMAIVVQGANSSIPLTNNTSVTTNGDSVESAELGWLNGTGSVATGTANPGIATDAFVSQRATAPTRLTRGDATGSNGVGFADASAIVNEFLNGVLANGQPDCNEDGAVGFADASCAVNIFLNGGN